MYSFLNRYFLYPAYWTYNKDQRLKRFREIEQRQWLSADEITAKQFNDAIHIFQYAYRHVPYYRELYSSHKIVPSDIKKQEDFAKLPILSKKDLQKYGPKLISENSSPEDRYEDASGGSTGQPTIFWGDRNNVYKKFAANLLMDTWTGWKIGEKSAYLWGADRETNKVRVLKEKFVQKFILRQDILNAFCMTEEKMISFAQHLQKNKPSLIVAYTNAAYLFADFLQKKGISGISPKGIVCSAETLTKEKRQVIEKAFQCKVLNRYGSREVGLIASECQHQQGLHINAHDVYVELIPVADGRQCEIIVTDLNNHVMPFIRYNMGDVASAAFYKKCSCGRGFPLIEKVEGRTSDFILHPDGRLIHGEFFSHAFYGIGKIKQFQIIQDAMDSIDINIVSSDKLSNDEKNHIMHKLQGELNNKIRIQIQEVDNIPTPSSGKFRFAIRNIS